MTDASSYVSGQTITYTATVSALTGSGTPTGSVSDGSKVVCTVTLSGGTGTCTFSEPVGGYTLTGTYSGDTQFSGSTSNPVDITVTQATSTVSLSATSETVGVPITLTATVSALTGSGTPT